MDQPDPPQHTRFELARYWLVYMAFLGMEAVLKMLPLILIWHVGRAMGAVSWYAIGTYRRLVQRNIQIAFGREKDAAWLKKTSRAHFLSVFANGLSGLKLATMTREQIEARVRLDGMEHMQAALALGQPILGLVTHQSCWEVLNKLPNFCSFGRHPGVIYQPLHNPYMDAHVLRARQKHGYAIFNRHEGFHAPMKHLREGGSLGILVDQHAGDLGVWAPFFDRLASTTPIAGMVALRTKAIMVTLAVYDDGPARWRASYGPAIRPGAGSTFQTLTAEVNQAVEALIRQQPESWFWVHNRWKTPKPHLMLNSYRRGIAYPPGYDVSKLQPFELLVRSPNWLGDACMAFPAVRAMKGGRPDLKLTVFGPEKLRDLWEAQPEVDRYIGKDNKEGLLAVARRIKKTGIYFDTGLLLTNSTRSTLELKLAGIQRLVGFTGSFRSKFLRHKIREPKVKGPPMHHTDKYLYIAKIIGSDISGALVPTRPEPDSVHGFKIGICAGAEYGQAKRWPLDRFAEVMKQVSSKHAGIEWAFYGAPGEAAMGEQLSVLVGEGVKHTNLVGKTKLAGLITQLRTCHLLVTNDTGTMHLAAALGVPTVSIFGSTEPVLTGPLGDQHTVIRHQVPCSPCFKRECPFGHYECMTRITPEKVAGAVLARVK
ncbi:MAG: lipopolysaccharide heptosyltransferase II [Verrucomicrobiota bacterium]